MTAIGKASLDPRLCCLGRLSISLAVKPGNEATAKQSFGTTQAVFIRHTCTCKLACLVKTARMVPKRCKYSFAYRRHHRRTSSIVSTSTTTRPSSSVSIELVVIAIVVLTCVAVVYYCCWCRPTLCCPFLSVVVFLLRVLVLPATENTRMW